MASTLAIAQTFDLNIDQFRAAFDAQSKKESAWPDAVATIKTVTKAGPKTYKVTLNDAVFVRMVKTWKELDLANGKFTLKDRLEIGVGADQKLDRITISSSRADMNLFHFLSTMATTARVLDPGISKDQLQDIVNELGLMKGDAAKGIGSPKDTFTKGAVITCLQFPSVVSLDIACAFTPRS